MKKLLAGNTSNWQCAIRNWQWVVLLRKTTGKQERENLPVANCQLPIGMPLSSLPQLLALACFILLSPSFTRAQAYSISTDLQKINIAMFEAKDLYMELDYMLYFDSEIRSQMKGVVKRNNRMVYQEVGNITVVKNEKYSVFVNHDEKLIVVDANPELKDPIKKEDLFLINVDSLKPWILSSELTESGGVRSITFILIKGTYSSIKIDYDPSTYFLKKMELVARETHLSTDNNEYNVRMEVLFNTTSTDATFSKDLFSEKTFVNIQNKNEVSTVGTYKKYRLINNLNKTIDYVKK